MSLESQIFNMNCNDCIHLKRSLSGRQNHVDFHYDMQKSLFNTKRIKLLKKGERHLIKSEKEPEKKEYYKEKAKNNFKEARKMKFVFSEDSCSLFYGKCYKSKKEFSFIPDTIMEENINCFKHRSNES